MLVLLVDLINTLESKNGEDKMTKEERDLLLKWRVNTKNNFLVAGAIASGLTFAATRKLQLINRLCLAGGAGCSAVIWRLGESSRTCVDQILGLDGSRMQHELKKIVLQRFGDDPRKMRNFSKHFYGEEVYSDANPEHPRLMYRQKHVFMDNPTITNEHVYGASETDGEQQNHHQRSSDRNSLKLKGPNAEIKQVRINPGISMYGYGDPLEVLFGYALGNEEGEQPADEAKVPGRYQKKLRRRQRMRQRHREALSLGEAQVLSG